MDGAGADAEAGRLALPPEHPEIHAYSLAGLKGNIEFVEDKSIPDHDALWLLAPSNAFRVSVHELISQRWFDNFVLVLIIVSSALMLAEDPVNPDATRNKIFEKMEYGFIALFTLEMLLKIIALGLVLHPRAYLRSGWNILDAVVVISSLLSIALAGSGIGFVRVLRILRILRPLRVINRAQKLKEVTMCLIASVRNIQPIFVLTILALLVFGVSGTQLYKGAFFSCSDESITTRAACVGSYNSTSPTTGVTVGVGRGGGG